MLNLREDASVIDYDELEDEPDPTNMGKYLVVAGLLVLPVLLHIGMSVFAERQCRSAVVEYIQRSNNPLALGIMLLEPETACETAISANWFPYFNKQRALRLIDSSRGGTLAGVFERATSENLTSALVGMAIGLVLFWRKDS